MAMTVTARAFTRIIAPHAATSPANGPTTLSHRADASPARAPAHSCGVRANSVTIPWSQSRLSMRSGSQWLRVRRHSVNAHRLLEAISVGLGEYLHDLLNHAAVGGDALCNLP